LNQEYQVLQTTLIGGILANLLLVLGGSLVAGGWNRLLQHFNLSAAHAASNMLSLAATSLLLPTASKLLGQATPDGLVTQSRGASVILVLVYALYLMYQLKTHRTVFEEESTKVPVKPWAKSGTVGPQASSLSRGLVAPAHFLSHSISDENERQRLSKLTMQPPRIYAREKEEDSDDDDDIEPQLQFYVAIATFAVSIALLFFSVDYAVNSIQALTRDAKLSSTFVGLILLPLPNCDFGPVSQAIRDNLDEALTYTMGKCLQTALLVTPSIVILAWCMGISEMSLVFDGFEIVSLFATVLLLNFLIINGRVTW
jgi:Ca2+:H+ antiporter